MDVATTSETIVHLVSFIDLVTIALSVVALIVTIIGFFASLKFYREGMKAQDLANKAMVSLSEKTAFIQSEINEIKNKTLDAAIHVSQDYEEIQSKVEELRASIVQEALDSIGETTLEETNKLKETVNQELAELKELVTTSRTSAEVRLQEIGPVRPVFLTESSSFGGVLPKKETLKAGIREVMRRFKKRPDQWVALHTIANNVGISIRLADRLIKEMVKDGEIKTRKIEDNIQFRLAD